MHHKKDKMQTITFDQSPLTESADSNNNTNVKKNGKYSLRQRHKRQCSRSKNHSDRAISPSENTTTDGRKTKQKPKPKAAPLSKYRRKTANARERTRMREINSAFENLRKCVPLSISNGTPTTTNEKLTKITTLRLAMKYIRTLNELLIKPNSDPSFVLNSILSNNNNSINFNNNTNHNNNNSNSCKNIFSENYFTTNNLTQNATVKRPCPAKISSKDRTKCLSNSYSSIKKPTDSPCLSPPIDSPIDLGLMLESDGESLHLSEPCLSPLSQSMKFDAARSALELGILLESDNDSLQLSEPCLSPLGGLDSLNPFSDLLHTGFSEQSSLDMYLT